MVKLAMHVERSWHGYIQRGRSEVEFAGGVGAVTFGIHAFGIRLEIGHHEALFG
jgi:hypothetical protein